MGKQAGATIMLSIVVALALSGCTANTPAFVPLPNGDDSTQAPLADTPTPTPTATRSLVLATCDAKTQLLVLTNIDLATGALEQPGDTAAPCKGTLSPDLKRVAIQLPTGKDGSSHVGWVDLATESTVDVTAKVTQAQGAMAAVPQHGNPTFSPQGAFVFGDFATGSVNAVDVTSFAVTTLSSEAVLAHSQLLFGPKGELSPLDTYRDFSFPAEIPGAPGSKFCDQYKNLAQAWLGDGTVLREDDGRVSVVHDTGVNEGSGCNGTEVVRYLSPKSDFTLGSLALDSKTGRSTSWRTEVRKKRSSKCRWMGAARP